MDDDNKNDILEDDYYSVLNLPKSVSQLKIVDIMQYYRYVKFDHLYTIYFRQPQKKLHLPIAV